MKKIPLRKCIVTREQLEKEFLVRIVRDKENNIFVDESGRMNGRGAYIKKDIEVLDKAIERNVLGRTFKTDIPDSIYEEIKEIILKK